ncbi:caspase family protein [Chryseobacterium schmidteae]|uniref:caspase family protein n=1 Tax=Chryseobacterium schmidteae TaxID=2730404 RepID=UPI00158E8D20|nr:caspase family protein [Chryseobacterium schmidteae]
MNKIIAIAIDEYQDDKLENLNNCVKDINSMIDVLSKKYVFDSIELYNKYEQTTLQFLYNELYNELINSLEEDNILIIFAGHGEFNAVLESSYWLCSNSEKDNITSWFNIENLIKFIKASPAKHIALISDSCFSGAIFELYRGGGIVAIKKKFSRQALTSGGIEKVSDGKKDENSPFCNAMVSVLEKNQLTDFSFNQFSESTILEFNKDKKQTPNFGQILNSGDKGGSYYFTLKSTDENILYNTINLPLEINKDVKIDSTFEIPFILENPNFNNNFVNTFIQQLGYSIINNIRIFITEDEDYSISRSKETGFYLHVGYEIQTLNEKFLSLTISGSNYFGSAHPNHYIHSINFAFKPERKLTFLDIVDYNSYENMESFMKEMVMKYAEDECKESLLKYCTYEYFSGLDFSFNSEVFSLYFTDLLPHVMFPCGFLEIPIEEIKFKI